MPYKEYQITKKYYTISEAVEFLETITGYKISTSSLRFWEREFELKIKRAKRKHRLYTLEDLKLFRILLTLSFKYDLTLSSIKKLIKSRELRARLTSFLLTENFEFKALNYGKS